MRYKFLLLVFIISIFLCISCTLHNTDNIRVERNNITLLIDRPYSSDLFTLRWPNYSDAITDMYTQFKYLNLNPFATKYDTYNIYVSIRCKEKDKYGNEYYDYGDSYLLVTVERDEINKYQSADYLDSEYGLFPKIKDIEDKTSYHIHM